MAFFSIPGNIKQRFLPFVLNPDASINDFDSSTSIFNDKTAGFARPQLFTYRRINASDGNKAVLGFYPMTSFPTGNDKAWEEANVSKLDKDLSFKLLYNSADDLLNKDYQSLTVNDIISELPGVSIREFLPDTRLDQCLNFFKDIFRQMSDLFMEAKNVGKSGNNQESSEQNKFYELMSKIWECTKFTIAYMTGVGPESFFSDVFNGESDAFRSGYMKFQKQNDFVKYVHDFPYILYYRLQSCTTTNIYQVPAMCEGKPIAWSDGKPGWGGGSGFMGTGELRATGFFNKVPVIGQLAEALLGNIGINYMPWWDAASGANVKQPEVQVTFDLFNDNVVRAVKNFIFVNTIVPSNRWIQYNMFQHSSNLYDVKIDGINRLFACSGSFEVKYEGALRNPPYHFMELLKSHVNKEMFNPDDFLNFLMTNDVIKIPDIYRVTMSFQSLLPANFNNFLYSYSQNVSHLTQYQNDVRDDTFGQHFGEGIKEYAKRVKKVWKDGNWKDGFNDSSAYTEIEAANKEYKSPAVEPSSDEG